MTRLKQIFLTLTLMTIMMPLSACESVDSAMQDVKNRFAEMNLSVPEVRPANERNPYNVNEGQYAETKTEQPAPIIISNEGETSDAVLAEAVQEAAAEPKTLADNLRFGDTCPKATMVRELNALHQFTNPERPSPESRISSLMLTGIKTKCKNNANNAVVEIDLTFEGSLGPRARARAADRPSFAYPYFLAITTDNGNIIAKEVFAASVNYDKNQDRIVHNENIRQIIPLNGEYGGQKAIMLGFQLNEGELAYNRSLKGTPPFMRDGKPEKIETAAGTESTDKPMAIVPAQKPPTIVIKKTEGEVATIEVKEEKPVTAIEEEPETPTQKIVEKVEDSAGEADSIVEETMSSAPPVVDESEVKDVLSEDVSESLSEEFSEKTEELQETSAALEESLNETAEETVEKMPEPPALPAAAEIKAAEPVTEEAEQAIIDITADD